MDSETMEDKRSTASDTITKLPITFRHWFETPDTWSRNQESLEMQNERLSAERDEVVQYVRMIKKMAVYLARKTKGNTEMSLGGFFKKAEENFPDYIRNEIALRGSD